MKILKLFLIVLAVSLLAACGPYEKIKNIGSTPEEIIENAPYADAKYKGFIFSLIFSGKHLNSTFLGYRLGMSKEEVEEYSQTLIAQNKLIDKADKDPFYHYIFNFGDSSREAMIFFRYNNDKLNSLQMSISNKDDSTPYTDIFLKEYINKYILHPEEGQKAYYYKDHPWKEMGMITDYNYIMFGADRITIYADTNKTFVAFDDLSNLPTARVIKD